MSTEAGELHIGYGYYMSPMIAQRSIAGEQVTPLALGAASWSFSTTPDEERAMRTIDAALDAGIRIIDTAHVYTNAVHPGHSEYLVGRALAANRLGSQAYVVTKGGHFREGDRFGIDLRRDSIHSHCEMSLELLGVDAIDLYLLHWPSFDAFAENLGGALEPVPPLHGDIALGEVMVAFAELLDEGMIRNAGLSNVSVTQLEEARSVVPIAAVENRFGPFKQDDRELIDYCAGEGIAYLAYSPLRAATNGPCAGLNWAEAFPGAAAVAEAKGISMQRLALAWMLQLSASLIPICGATRTETAIDSANAVAVELNDEDLELLDF